MKSIIRPTTTITNQPNKRHHKFQNIFYHIDFTDRLCYFLGRGGFPPRSLLGTLYYHFDDCYESSNFKGKLCKCSYHFYQLAYFLVHLRFLLSSLDDISIHYFLYNVNTFVYCFYIIYTYILTIYK